MAAPEGNQHAVGHGRPANPASPKGRVVFELHERKARYVAAASRRNMSLKDWLTEHLDAAAFAEKKQLDEESKARRMKRSPSSGDGPL